MRKVYMNERSPVKGSVSSSATQAEASAWGGFLYTYAILTRRLDKELREAHGLSFDSFEVLFLLACAPEQRMRLSDLAAAVLTNPTRISRLVDSLRGEGLVEREHSTQDRREYYAVLTEAGLIRLREAYQTHLSGVREYFLSHFSDLELSAMAGFWERLVPGASHRYDYTRSRTWWEEE
jgi:DNA-binding MarR family transcriptional regulator